MRNEMKVNQKRTDKGVRKDKNRSIQIFIPQKTVSASRSFMRDPFNYALLSSPFVSFIYLTQYLLQVTIL